MKYVLAFLALLFAVPALADPAPAAAPAPAKPAKPSSHHAANEPIGISADNFVAEKTPVKSGPGVINGTYTGNVIITQGDTRLRANRVRILIVDGHAQTAYADGNVVANSPTSGTATGDNGVYEVAPRIITLTGHVVLTKEKNVMRGAQLTVNMVTGVANLGGGVKGQAGGGRVQGLFTPPPSKDDK
jgi:lipopolysaccharide export system protein LptA